MFAVYYAVRTRFTVEGLSVIESILFFGEALQVVCDL